MRKNKAILFIIILVLVTVIDLFLLMYFGVPLIMVADIGTLVFYGIIFVAFMMLHLFLFYKLTKLFHGKSSKDSI